MNLSRSASIFVVAGTILAQPVLGTTIQLISDQNLVDRSPIVVVGSIEGHRDPVQMPPVTDWTVSIEKVLKGDLGQGRVDVRIPGGLAPNGLKKYIYGTPKLAKGQRALLFLTRGRDGELRLVDLVQGAFIAAKTSRRTFARRDFRDVSVLPQSGRSSSRQPMRDFDRFSNWIEDRASGLKRLPDYETRPSRSELSSMPSDFTLSEADGAGLRWVVFDSGGSVTWLSHTTPLVNLTGGGVNEFQRALAVWNNEPTTPIRYLYGGTTTSDLGLTSADSINSVVWTDPHDEMPGAFDCTVGGTLAHASPWYVPNSTNVFNGKSFHRIVQGDIVFNDGIECRKFSSPNYSEFIEQIAAHELGHTLGLSHSSEDPNERNTILKTALMYYRAQDNGKGAVLNSDDIAGIQTLYRKGGAAGGGGGGGSKPPATGCPAGTPANTLCLLKGRFRVTGTWNNQFDNSSGTAMPIVNTDLAGFFYFTDPSNVELIIKILDFGTEFKVFYSQLTNLRFTLAVTDTSTGKTKNYSNTTGECGAIDQNFGASALTSEVVSGSELQAAPLPATGTCGASATTLCLLDKRFSVTVTWRNQFDGSSGVGQAKTLSALTGAFSFSDPANLEILIKTLDFSDHVLVIYGSLSNFEYTIRVTDTITGAAKEYRNAAGTYCGGLDERAF